MRSISPSPFLRVAHRGGSALAPENTLAAFRHALTLPVDALEMDVQMSRDGHAVVFHDETLERLTDGQGNMLDLDLAYLQSLNVAAHFASGWPEPQQMPDLREVLELVQQSGVQAFIEIKPSLRGTTYGRYPGIAEAVAHEVQASGIQHQAMIMSFDWAVLPHVKALLPEVSTGLLVSEDVWQPQPPGALQTLVEQAHELQCAWIHLDYRLFTPDLPAFFHTHNLRLGIWTANERQDIQLLALAGVDAITTDHPDLF